MARASFGGGTADYLEDAQGKRIAGSVSLWSAAVGGTRYSDLLVGGVAVTSVTSDVYGSLPEFSGPDGILKMYADGNGGRRVVLEAHDDTLPTDAAVDAGLVRAGAPFVTRSSVDVLVANYASPQAAVTAAEALGVPAIVKFGNGSQTLSTTLTVAASNIALDLGNASLSKTTTGAAIRFAGTSAVRLSGVAVRGGKINLTGTGTVGVAFDFCDEPRADGVDVRNGAGSASAAVSFTSCARPIATACRAEAVGVGVSLDSSTSGSVVGGVFRNLMRDGVLAFNGSHDVTVAGVVVDGFCTSAEAGRGGIHIYGSNGASVTGCTVKSGTVGGTQDSPKIRFRDGLDFACSGNVVSGALGGGIGVIALSDIGTGAGKGTITGNTVRDVQGNGIQVALGTGGVATSLHPVTVSGNTIIGVFQVGTTIAGNGISIAAAADACVVANNYVDDTDGEGITVNTLAAITGNIVRSPGQGTLGGKVGIYVTGGASVVTGNYCFDDQVTKTMANGLRVLAGATARVGANILTDATSAAVRNDGTTSTQVGEIASALIGFYGKAPVARPAAIATPTADVTALKTAVDALRSALTTLGLTA